MSSDREAELLSVLVRVLEIQDAHDNLMIGLVEGIGRQTFLKSQLYAAETANDRFGIRSANTNLAEVETGIRNLRRQMTELTAERREITAKVLRSLTDVTDGIRRERGMRGGPRDEGGATM